MKVRYGRTSLVLAALCALGGAAASQCERSPLAPPDAGPSDHFGAAVGLAGGMLLVGAPGDDDVYPSSGSVYVCRRGGAGWFALDEFRPVDPHTPKTFGASLSTSGLRALIGAPLDEDVGTATGSAYVFEYNGTDWVQRKKLQASDADAEDRFGEAVALAGDRAIVGAPGKWSTLEPAVGAAYVFERQGTTWVELAKLLAPNGDDGDYFGSAVAIEGDRAVVGAPEHQGADIWTGSVYVFERQGTDWAFTAELIAGDPAFFDRFGVSLSLQGDELLIGSEDSLGGGPLLDAGAVYAFELRGSTWVEVQKIPPSDPSNGGRFGSALARDGNRLLVGSEWDDDHGLFSGSAYVLELGPTGWVEVQKLVGAATATGDQLSHAVALTGDTVFLGAPSHDGVAQNSGLVHVFTLAAPRVYCTAKPTSLGCIPQIATTGGPSASGTTPFTVDVADVPSGKFGMLAYGSGAIAVPFKGGLVCIEPPIRRTPVLPTGGSYPPTDCSGTLAFDFGAWIQSGVDPLLVPGRLVNAQWWLRDPEHPDGTGTGLSDAVEFTICL